MHRILFHWGPVTIYSYGAMMVAAFLTATWLASRAAPPPVCSPEANLGPSGRQTGGGVLSSTQIVDVFCLAMLGGVLGARLFFVVQHWEVFVREPLEIPAIWHGGLVWYGGFLGGVLSALAYLRLRRIPFLRAADQCIPYVALAHAIGRIGCFLNGCCYGKPIDHTQMPTQLLESVSLLVLFLVLRRFQQRYVSGPAGRLFGVYLIGYAVIRFVIEFLRGDQTVMWAGLTLQQLLSIGVLLAGGLLIAARPRRHGA